MAPHADTPQTVAEAVDWLMLYLEAPDLAALAASDEADLIDQHFELGLMIRNAFALHENPALVAESGAANADDASLVIIRALWRRLNPLH